MASSAAGRGLNALWNLMVPRKPPGAVPTSSSPTWNPQQASVVKASPGYQDHLQTLYQNRTSMNSQDLLQFMFLNDPDVSAAVGGYLTMADTDIRLVAKNPQTLQIDPAATQQLQQYVAALFAITDFTQGYTFKSNLRTFCQELRYMGLLRGAIASELLFSKQLVPARLQNVDTKSIYWFEPTSGTYKPAQRTPGVQGPLMGMVSLDIPSFWVAHHRRDPTTLYPTSTFVSVINTAAAREEVINDLYRIMQSSGYPRIGLKVIEETLMKNAPPNLKEDPNAAKSWALSQLSAIANAYAGLRSDQPFAFFDSVEPSMINEKNPGVGVNITSVIEVLNAQNQAALKTMATVIGRGSAGVNTASVEARIAAMNADELNVPLVQLLSQAFTFMMAAYGISCIAEVSFAPAELRPLTELEPMLALRAARLRADLSLGLISDEEYSLEMYGRLPLTGQKPLSGTNFNPAGGPTVDQSAVSPNSDPLGRSQSPEGKL